MCGIVAVVRRPSRRSPPRPEEILAGLDAAAAVLGGWQGDAANALGGAAGHLEEIDLLLRGVPGVRCLVGDGELAADVDRRVERITRQLTDVEVGLDLGQLAVDELEKVNAALVRARDGAWAVLNDRLRTARAVAELAGADRSPGALEAFTSIQVALSALDRLEVRGRDSAGLHVLVSGHGLDPDGADVRAAVEARADPLFTSGAVRTAEGHLCFVYKAAAEIGELGDNTRVLRDAVRADELLHRALRSDTAVATVLGHTRWASVGIVSEPNAHPLNHEEAGRDGPYAAAALNGDVDNFAALITEHGLELPAEVTTDAKVIPVLVSRHLAGGSDADDAFLETVRALDGSVAVAATLAATPRRLHLAQRGSGQALYVGFAEDAFVVASEPYGLVEETARYLRIDGETPSGADGSRGQAVVLDGERAGEPAGVRRLAYEGTDLPLGDDDVRLAEITTRDIDRRGAPHFLIKEISESPTSMRKTLRGKVREAADGVLSVALPDEALPPSVRSRLVSGGIRRIVVIGQGTAAVAGRGVAAAIDSALGDTDIRVSAETATELSGFGLRDEMDDTMVVAISQSGTTTDTNRTVDLARARGAAVLAIVNRRNSDLVQKAEGVLYTSDGRDVEMAVPSTKAFYAQVTAGVLLAVGLADAAGYGDRHRTHEMLGALRALPSAMERVLELRAGIAAAARLHAPPRRYWAVVGNGVNRVAAEEVRIKLSELCYKSIACDATEDKKHIDLAAEPLILVCAAGLDGATADDVGKEVAIYRAHKAAPIVIASEGERRFDAALEVIEVPRVHPELDFLLSAMAGHLFGYEAAMAIDAQARLLREARAAVEEVLATPASDIELLEILGPRLREAAGRFFAEMAERRFDGHLEASTAVRLSSVLRAASGTLPLELYQVEVGRPATPASVVEDLTTVLARAIDELTRPVDAIKHQAKTVTVGISRSEESFLAAPLVRAVLATGVPRDRLSYKALRTLAALDPAVTEVTGFTRYAVEGDVAAGTAAVTVVDKGGIAADIRSRTEHDPTLRGTKHRAAATREVTVARGGDDRSVIHVPEVRDHTVAGITLLHARFEDVLPADAARAVLSGYQSRYAALVDAVTETEPSFRDDVLGEVPIFDLLVTPVQEMARRWRGA